MLDKGNIGQVIMWTDDDDQCQHDNINELSHTTKQYPSVCYLYHLAVYGDIQITI